MADIKYLIEVDDSGAVKQIKDFDDSLRGVEKTSEKTGTAATGLWKQIAIGQFAYDAARKAGSFFVDFLKSSITEAGNAEKADKSLAAALEITGRPVKALTEHFKSFAEEMQKATTFEDDQVKQAQTLLIQLTNLDKDGLDKATKGAIGLASVMNMDLSSAAMVVEKAVNGNAGALSRYGIQIDGTQSKEVIRAQALEKLCALYPRATADTETYSGKIAQLKNRYADLQESAGNALIKGLQPLMDAVSDPEVMTGITSLVTAVMGMVAKIAEGYGYLGQMIAYFATSEKNAAQVAIESSATIATSYIARREALEKYGASYKDIAAGIQDFSRDAQGAIIDEGTAFEKLLQAVKSGDPYYKSLKGAVDQFVVSQREAATAEGKAQAALAKTKPLLEGNTKGTNTFTDAIDKQTKKMVTQADLYQDMPGMVHKIASALDTMPPAFDKITKSEKKSLMEFFDFEMGVKKGSKETTKDIVRQWVEVFNTAREVFNGMGSLADANYRKQQKLIDGLYKIQTNALDKEYNDKIAAMDAIAAAEDYQNKKKEIMNSTMTETEKAAALAALDAEIAKAAAKTKLDTDYATAKTKIDADYAAASEAARIRSAKAQKQVAYVTAVMNIAEGITKAFAQGGILGFITGALVAAAGAVQIAAIKATPLSKGAIFKQPTLLAGANGQDYQVAEAGEPEIVASPSNIRKAVGLDKGGRGGGGRPITLVINNYIAGQKIQEQIIKIVQDASEIGSLRISAKAVG